MKSESYNIKNIDFKFKNENKKIYTTNNSSKDINKVRSDFYIPCNKNALSQQQSRINSGLKLQACKDPFSNHSSSSNNEKNMIILKSKNIDKNENLYKEEIYQKPYLKSSNNIGILALDKQNQLSNETSSKYVFDNKKKDSISLLSYGSNSRRRKSVSKEELYSEYIQTTKDMFKKNYKSSYNQDINSPTKETNQSQSPLLEKQNKLTVNSGYNKNNPRKNASITSNESTNRIKDSNKKDPNQEKKINKQENLASNKISHQKKLLDKAPMNTESSDLKINICNINSNTEINTNKYFENSKSKRTFERDLLTSNSRIKTILRNHSKRQLDEYSERNVNKDKNLEKNFMRNNTKKNTDYNTSGLDNDSKARGNENSLHILINKMNESGFINENLLGKQTNKAQLNNKNYDKSCISPKRNQLEVSFSPSRREPNSNRSSKFATSVQNVINTSNKLNKGSFRDYINVSTATINDLVNSKFPAGVTSLNFGSHAVINTRRGENTQRRSSEDNSKKTKDVGALQSLCKELIKNIEKQDVTYANRALNSLCLYFQSYCPSIIPQSNKQTGKTNISSFSPKSVKKNDLNKFEQNKLNPKEKNNQANQNNYLNQILQQISLNNQNDTNPLQNLDMQELGMLILNITNNNKMGNNPSQSSTELFKKIISAISLATLNNTNALNSSRQIEGSKKARSRDGYSKLQNKLFNNIKSKNKENFSEPNMFDENVIFPCIRNNHNIEFYDTIKKNKLISHLRDEKGYSPLLLAIVSNNLEIAKYIIEQRLELINTIHDPTGNTGLHLALVHKNNLIANLLIKYDINQNIKNKDGKIAWDYA